MLPISRQLSLDREQPGVASNPRLRACTWTRVPGANSHTAPMLARVSVLCFLSTLSVAPKPARGVVKSRQTQVCTHPSPEVMLPHPQRVVSRSLDSHSSWGPPSGCAPSQPVRPGSSSPNISAPGFPTSQVPVSAVREHLAQRECSAYTRPPPNAPPNTYTHTHTAGAQLPPSSPVCLLSSPAASAPLNDSPLP